MFVFDVVWCDVSTQEKIKAELTEANSKLTSEQQKGQKLQTTLSKARGSLLFRPRQKKEICLLDW
jgi:hypothetical protein